MNNRFSLLALTAGMLLAGASHSAAQTFTKIAESTGEFYGTPAINNFGQVAFEVTNGTTFSSRIVRGSVGTTSLTTIATTAAPTPTPGISFVITPPSINDGGVVAFRAAKTDGNHAIYTGTGAALTTIDTFAGFFTSNPNVSMSASGVVAFYRETLSTSAIYTGDGTGSASPLVTDAGTFANFSNLQINDLNLIAFAGYKDGGGLGIYLSTDLTTPLVTTSTDSIVGINNAGHVIFQEIFGTDSAILYKVIGGVPTPIIDGVAGPFGVFDAAAINNPGQVAFRASTDGGDSGIYFGPDPVADKLIKVGDTLFDGTVTGLTFWNEGLNDLGDIAFTYVLNNGKVGVAVARVPEPASMGLLLGFTAMGLRRRRGC